MSDINVQLLENGDSYTSRGCGTSDHYHEISQEEYDRVTAIEGYRGKLSAEAEAKISDAVRYGYGFYGCRLYKNDMTGKCYYVECIGNSCD